MTTPDGGTRLFYWPKQEAPAEAEPEKTENQAVISEPSEEQEETAVSLKAIENGEDLPDVLFKAELNASEVRDLYEAVEKDSFRPA